MKKIISVIAAFIFEFSLFALPGVEPYLKDSAGDYVYYRDYSFARESYVGILSYDSTTFQLRYYAPTDRVNYLPEKEIALLLTINPESDYIEFTGERIISALTPNSEDVDLVNYLHDIMYELSERRGKMLEVNPELDDYKTNGGVWDNGLRSIQEYAQFGGDVVITFDAIIPIFNIKNISNLENEKLLSCVTFGTLKASEDKSFDNFKGFLEVPADNSHSFKQNKKAKKSAFNHNGRTITLDSDWISPMDGYWFLGETAYFTVSEFPVIQTEQRIQFEQFLCRNFLKNSPESYIDLQNAKVEKTKKGDYVKFTTEIYQNKGAGQEKMVSIKVLKFQSDGSAQLTMLSVFADEYTSKKKYFDSILAKN